MDAANAGLAHGAAGRALRGFRRVPVAVREELAQEAALRAHVDPAVRDPAAYAAEAARRLAIDWMRREWRSAGAGGLSHHEEVVPWACRVEASLDLARVSALLARGPRRHGHTLRTLVLEERAIDELIGPGDGRARDLWYKRRRRAVAWVRAAAAW